MLTTRPPPNVAASRVWRETSHALTSNAGMTMNTNSLSSFRTE
jgi:hypothetical protein